MQFIKNFLSSPIKVIGATTCLFLMYGIHLMVKLDELFLANVFLFYGCFLIYIGRVLLEEKE